MANAAPYIAKPLRRLFAGAIDFLLCVVLVFFVWGVVVSSTTATSYLEVALLNKVAFVAYAAYHVLFFGMFHSQTPGLFFFDMRVVRSKDGAELSLTQSLIRGSVRPVVLYLVAFGAVMAQPVIGGAAIVVAIPIVVELGMMFTLPTRQTLTDVLAKTFVINVPSPRPHRAPAAPMYSATDAEFGPPPRRVK
jgi:uncharacterized RDD family membrane protein YckC